MASLNKGQWLHFVSFLCLFVGPRQDRPSSSSHSVSSQEDPLLKWSWFFPFYFFCDSWIKTYPSLPSPLLLLSPHISLQVGSEKFDAIEIIFARIKRKAALVMAVARAWHGCQGGRMCRLICFEPSHRSLPISLSYPLVYCCCSGFHRPDYPSETNVSFKDLLFCHHIWSSSATQKAWICFNELCSSKTCFKRWHERVIMWN